MFMPSLNLGESDLYLKGNQLNCGVVRVDWGICAERWGSLRRTGTFRKAICDLAANCAWYSTTSDQPLGMLSSALFRLTRQRFGIRIVPWIIESA